MTRLEDARRTARKIAEERYPEARVVLLAGSVIRGEDTAHSDLDLVVIYTKLPRARRESYVFDGWPVEAFVNDPETLRYFVEEFDLKLCEPVIPTMLAEGICVFGDREFAAPIQDEARGRLKQGPPPLSPGDIDLRRYAITDNIDDIRQPKSKAELQATGTVLYGQLAQFFFRTRGLWCARRKMIPRKLKEADAAFGDEFVAAFEALFAGDAGAVIELSENLLKPFGGWLFAGYSSEAPENFRRA
jgi:hypothetical protein